MELFLLIGIALLPFAIFIARKKTSLIKFILIAAFFQGVLNLVGVPVLARQFAVELAVLILFLASILSPGENKNFRVPLVGWFALFTIITIVSAVYNQSNAANTILMYRNVLWPYLLFLSVVNLNLSAIQFHNINKLIIALFIIQIPAAIIKFSFLGFREGVIQGTFAGSAGTAAVIFPLFAIGFVIAIILTRKTNAIHLLLIIGFMGMALVTGKRAFFIIMPVFVLIGYFVYQYYSNNFNYKKLALNTLLILIIGFAGIYSGARLTPSLNPDNVRGGSFDIVYVINYVLEYEQQVNPVTGEAGGRLSSSQMVIDYYQRQDIELMLIFGGGPDLLYLDTQRKVRSDFAIAYGITGLIFYLLSIGIFGAFAVFILFGIPGYKAIQQFRYIENTHLKIIAFGVFMGSLVFAFDFIAYSRYFVFSYIPSFIYFYYAGLLNNITFMNKYNDL